jgi:DnaA family protein
LFHLINRARDHGCRLLFSAASAPRQLGVQLADLESRLSWGVVFALPDYSDLEKTRILQFRAARRGMQLGDDSANYILARAARSLADLIALLEQLDRASMVAQRQLSIPFIRQTLGW